MIIKAVHAIFTLMADLIFVLFVLKVDLNEWL